MGVRALIFCTVIAASPSTMVAQHPAPTSPARVAGIAPPPAPVNPPSNVGGTNPVFFGNIPVLVFADGRVFADFGRGYEQVVRSCALPVGYNNQVVPSSSPVQPTVVQPTVSQPPIPTSAPSLPYTPRVPAQLTASQQMLTQPAQASSQTVVNTQSCWAVGATGRVFVGWP